MWRRMLIDQQFRELVQSLQIESSLSLIAVNAGIDEKMAHKYRTHT